MSTTFRFRFRFRSLHSLGSLPFLFFISALQLYLFLAVRFILFVFLFTAFCVYFFFFFDTLRPLSLSSASAVPVDWGMDLGTDPAPRCRRGLLMSTLMKYALILTHTYAHTRTHAFNSFTRILTHA